MTPKQRFLPAILDLVVPVLKGAGFRRKGSTFTLTISDDVHMVVQMMIVRPIVDGAMELRPHVYIYSHRFAQLGRDWEGPPDLCMSAIDIAVSRLVDRRDHGLWRIGTESEAKAAGSVIVDQICRGALPLVSRVQTADQICDALIQDPSLNIARNFKVEEWCQRYRAATGGPPFEPRDYTQQLEKEAVMLEGIHETLKKLG
ncbi:MAG: DUF4304 domain-containing protein [Fimbriimonadaceae bacterium]